MAYLNGRKILLPFNVSTYNVTAGGNKVFEKIATITVTPDANGDLPTTILFTTDDNGQPFELTDLYCHIKAGITNGGTSRFWISSNGLLLSSQINVMQNSLRYWYFRYDTFGINNGGQWSAPNQTLGTDFPNGNMMQGVSLVTPINRESNRVNVLNKIPKVEIKIISGDGKWLEGSTFELWGVRA